MKPTKDFVKATLDQFIDPEWMQSSNLPKHIVYFIAHGGNPCWIIEDLLIFIEIQRSQIEGTDRGDKEVPAWIESAFRRDARSNLTVVSPNDLK